MHELAITAEIIDIVTEQSQGRKITRVVLEIGKSPASCRMRSRFCFAMCSEGTVAEGATLEIIEPPGRARCRACGVEFVLEQPFGQCRCGSCDLQWLCGTELTIKRMEVLECASPVDVPTPTAPR